ncbi:MAG: hypothetical protein AAGA02_12140 [Bacteroidota bacterium]
MANHTVVFDLHLERYAAVNKANFKQKKNLTESRMIPVDFLDPAGIPRL